MRDDMKRLITRRPRSSQSPRSNRPLQCREKRIYGNQIDRFERKFESMTLRHRRNFGGKELRDYWSPLVRFLESRVGHHWDDVYSEICRVTGSKGILAHHLRDHVKDLVGGIGHSNHHTYFNPDPKNANYGYRMFFVNDEKILCLNPNRAFRI